MRIKISALALIPDHIGSANATSARRLRTRHQPPVLAYEGTLYESRRAGNGCATLHFFDSGFQWQ